MLPRFRAIVREYNVFKVALDQGDAGIPNFKYTQKQHVRVKALQLDESMFEAPTTRLLSRPPTYTAATNRSSSRIEMGDAAYAELCAGLLAGIAWM